MVDDDDARLAELVGELDGVLLDRLEYAREPDLVERRPGRGVPLEDRALDPGAVRVAGEVRGLVVPVRRIRGLAGQRREAFGVGVREALLDQDLGDEVELLLLRLDQLVAVEPGEREDRGQREHEDHPRDPDDDLTQERAAGAGVRGRGTRDLVVGAGAGAQVRGSFGGLVARAHRLPHGFRFPLTLSRVRMSASCLERSSPGGRRSR